jgi:hypothetical protein
MCPTCQATVARPERVDSPLTRPAAQHYRIDNDVDWVVVERLISGHNPARSSTSERLAAVARMTIARIPASVMAERIGITRRSIERLKARIRTQASTHAPDKTNR